MKIKERISEYKVLKSNAGYFIGRDCESGFYSKNSKYFLTEEDAKVALSKHEYEED